ncbi:MAG TPA: tRNA uridine-5-carboxymethylaminomethyl(34) synthesis GTPase MnmE [Lacunisphaera sp.]|jgi:tRNA modification GTPase|nr:tRNA uridine-5-carboxymethylaminomethyl(34) synthesis GTPase MnmE [Lacunisphaera sp.]
MAHTADTITALATPVGTSAIAVVRVSGPEVGRLTPALFGELPPPRQARRADFRDRHGAVLDDVLFTWFAGPNSFTGEDTLEISCHGNPFIAQKILEDLAARGCRLAEAGEFSKRAFLNGRMDLSQAEAVMDLIHARSERALAAANQQLRGSLGRQMNSLVSRLLDALAHIEAYIDFPDEDLPPEDRNSLRREIEALVVDTRRLRATSHYGALLRDGIKTVILGETNAGKSSLLNRMVGRERALVSAEPGTTRDYIEERLVLGPHWFRLVDTAGLNETPSALERRGIDKTLEQAADASVFLWVIDGTRPLPAAAPAALAGLMTRENTVAVINKADLLAKDFMPPAMPFRAVPISALNGRGLDELESAIVAIAGHLLPDNDESLVAINARHAHALDEALQGLESAVAKLASKGDSILVSSDLRMSLAAYSQIAGKVDNEAMLDRLFSTFCIGK